MAAERVRLEFTPRRTSKLRVRSFLYVFAAMPLFFPCPFLTCRNCVRFQTTPETTQNWWRDRMSSAQVNLDDLDREAEADARRKNKPKRLTAVDLASGIAGKDFKPAIPDDSSPRRSKPVTPIGKISGIVRKSGSKFFTPPSFSRESSAHDVRQRATHWTCSGVSPPAPPLPPLLFPAFRAPLTTSSFNHLIFIEEF